jgi:hypothetical protein
LEWGVHIRVGVHLARIQVLSHTLLAKVGVHLARIRVLSHTFLSKVGGEASGELFAVSVRDYEFEFLHMAELRDVEGEKRRK